METAQREKAPLPRRLICGLGKAAAGLAISLPLALAWGVGHAHTSDYVGPQKAEFTTNYSGEVRADLGLLGDSYIPIPSEDKIGSIGLDVTVGGIGSNLGNKSVDPYLLLEQYVGVYTNPSFTIEGVKSGLEHSMLEEALEAEALFMALGGVVALRRHIFSDKVLDKLPSSRVMVSAALATSVMLSTSALASPVPTDTAPRTLITALEGTPFEGATTDNTTGEGYLNRAIGAIDKLSSRQTKIMNAYIKTASDNLDRQKDLLAKPREGESMYLGYSDLHCSLAMTNLIGQLIKISNPDLVLDSGDDTMGGTKAEEFCIRKKAEMIGGVDSLTALGNHDSAVTAKQLKDNDLPGLDGKIVEARPESITVIGDSDPEQNLPFSWDRVMRRSETEAQMGERLAKLAHDKNIDVVMVHQPGAAMSFIEHSVGDDPRLVLWGHMHCEEEHVIWNADGTWTLALQQGTAGGIVEPSIGGVSIPWTPPRKEAEVDLLFQDKQTGLITGRQRIRFAPDGRVTIDKREDIGDRVRLQQIKNQTQILNKKGPANRPVAREKVSSHR